MSPFLGCQNVKCSEIILSMGRSGTIIDKILKRHVFNSRSHDLSLSNYIRHSSGDPSQEDGFSESVGRGECPQRKLQSSRTGSEVDSANTQ